MEKNPGVKVKKFELLEISSNALRRVLTPSNIKDGFRCTGIWPLDYDAILHEMACGQDFEVHVDDEDVVAEYVDASDNMLSLSQGHLQPLGDIDEHVSDT